MPAAAIYLLSRTRSLVFLSEGRLGFLVPGRLLVMDDLPWPLPFGLLRLSSRGLEPLSPVRDGLEPILLLPCFLEPPCLPGPGLDDPELLRSEEDPLLPPFFGASGLLNGLIINYC
jgi:hypothetical protein